MEDNRGVYLMAMAMFNDLKNVKLFHKTDRSLNPYLALIRRFYTSPSFTLPHYIPLSDLLD